MIDTYIPACMSKNDVSNVGTFDQPAKRAIVIFSPLYYPTKSLLFETKCVLNIKIIRLSLKITLNKQNNFRNGLSSQNIMKMCYYTCS